MCEVFTELCTVHCCGVQSAYRAQFTMRKPIQRGEKSWKNTEREREREVILLSVYTVLYTVLSSLLTGNNISL